MQLVDVQALRPQAVLASQLGGFSKNVDDGVVRRGGDEYAERSLRFARGQGVADEDVRDRVRLARAGRPPDERQRLAEDAAPGGPLPLVEHPVRVMAARFDKFPEPALRRGVLNDRRLPAFDRPALQQLVEVHRGLRVLVERA